MTAAQNDVILLNPNDNVVIALRDIGSGVPVTGVAAPLADAVSRGHKIAARPISAGQNVIRYGQIIGVGHPRHRPGEMCTPTTSAWVRMNRTMPSRLICAPALARRATAFHGLSSPRRPGRHAQLHRDSHVGECSGSVARFIAEGVERSGMLDAFPNVDGVVPIVHGTGCGMSARTKAMTRCFAPLAAMPANPNFAAILWWALAAR